MNDTPQGDGNFKGYYENGDLKWEDNIRMNDTPQGDGN